MNFKPPVNEKTYQKLVEDMINADIREADLSETYYAASTKGGQKANKTAVGVQLRHQPTGILVQCCRTRSKALNRYYARKYLLLRMAEEGLIDSKLSRKRSAKIQKARKQKKRRQRRSRSASVSDKPIES